MSGCTEPPCEGVPAADWLAPGVVPNCDEPGVAGSTLTCLVCLFWSSGDPVASCIDSMDSSRVVSSSSSATVMLGSFGGVCLACLPGEVSPFPSSEFACLPILPELESESESESEELEEDEVVELESELDSDKRRSECASTVGGGLRSYSSRNNRNSLQVSVGESRKKDCKYSGIMSALHGSILNLPC